MELALSLHYENSNTYGTNCIPDSHSQSFRLMTEKPHNQEEIQGEVNEETRKDWLQLGLADSTGESTRRLSRISNRIELDLFQKQQRQASSSVRIIEEQSSLPPSAAVNGWRQQISWFPTTITGGYPVQSVRQQYSSEQQLAFGPGSSSSSPSRFAANLMIVSPPARPQAGLWLQLQAAQNQVNESILPQIPKNYFRIKDGRMTIRLLMKYLANKLGLEDEDGEVVLTCKGQELHPSVTLQDVRDDIWHSAEVVELNTNTSTTNHIMTFIYSRSKCGFKGKFIDAKTLIEHI